MTDTDIQTETESAEGGITDSSSFTVDETPDAATKPVNGRCSPTILTMLSVDEEDDAVLQAPPPGSAGGLKTKVKRTV